MWESYFLVEVIIVLLTFSKISKPFNFIQIAQRRFIQKLRFQNHLYLSHSSPLVCYRKREILPLSCFLGPGHMNRRQQIFLPQPYSTIPLLKVNSMKVAKEYYPTHGMKQTSDKQISEQDALS